MFWLDMILSLTLPFVAAGVFGVMMAVVFRHTVFNDKAVFTPPQPVAGHSRRKADRHRLARWESPMDAEIEHLKRKNLGF